MSEHDNSQTTNAEDVLFITNAAANKVLQLITEENDPSLSLRVYIQGGGCAGFQYGFGFDTNVKDDDTIINKDGIRILVDSLSLQYLHGATVDYVKNLQGEHFVVKNPNANTTCGCGSSFSA
jgi:iron-sulfur cluster insertion protein